LCKRIAEDGCHHGGKERSQFEHVRALFVDLVKTKGQTCTVRAMTVL
jgi:hypothetical protein